MWCIWTISKEGDTVKFKKLSRPNKLSIHHNESVCPVFHSKCATLCINTKC